MKRIIILILVLSSLFAFTSCSAYYGRSVKNNIDFYYLKRMPEYNIEDGIICPIKKQVDKYSSDEEWIKLINLYLKGPDDGNYISPFPPNTTLKRFSFDGDTLTVFLSNQISQLDGYDLTLACACLTKTVMKTKPVYAVEVCAEGGIIGDFISITMTNEGLLLLDNYSASGKE